MYKWGLVLFNIIFVLLGIFCLAIGMWVKFDNDSVLAALQRMPESAQEATSNVDIAGLLSSASTLLIIVGASIFGIGFFGCCGAWKEIRLFLIIYAFIVGVVFILEIAGVICFIFFREKVDAYLIPFLTYQLQNGYTQGVHYEAGQLVAEGDAASMAWDAIQISLKCCAVTDYSEYQNVTNWVNTYTDGDTTINDAKVPISCCKMQDPNAFPNDMEDIAFVDMWTCLENPSSENANIVGCYQSLLDYLNNYSAYCIAIGVLVLLIELCGMVFAFCLYGSVKKAEYKEV